MNEQDERVRDFYENLSMSKDRVEMLLKVAEDSAEAPSPGVTAVPATGMGWRSKLSSMQWGPWLQTAMGCALILMVSLWMHTSGSQTELATRTLREVAMNHTTRLEPEFRGSSLAMLDNSMHQLPFNLVLPKAIDSAYELIGSRYCSLGGVLAAHVRLHNKKSGKPLSLFVTSNSAELTKIQSQQQKLEGVEVEIWREGGLFFASAQRS